MGKWLRITGAVIVGVLTSCATLPSARAKLEAPPLGFFLGMGVVGVTVACTIFGIVRRNGNWEVTGWVLLGIFLFLTLISR